MLILAILSSLFSLISFIGLHYLDNRFKKKKSLSITMNTLVIIITYLAVLSLYSLSLLVPALRLSTPFIYVMYISISLYIAFAGYFNGLLESIGLTISILVVISSIIPVVNTDIVSFIVTPLSTFILFTLLLIQSIRAMRSDKKTNIQLDIHTLVLFLILVVIVMFFSYLSSLVEVYTPYSDYPRHFRSIMKMYYDPHGYGNILYKGYHSFAAFMLRVSFTEPDINSLYYMLMFFDISLLMIVYEYFNKTLRKPWLPLYIWIFAGNLSVIASLIVSWCPISGFCQLINITSFRNYVLFKLVDPEALGLFMFIPLIYGLRRKDGTLIGMLKKIVLLWSLSLVYIPHILLYAAMVGASIKKGRELIEYLCLFIAISFLGALLVNGSGAIFLIIIGAYIILIISYALIQIFKLLWKKFQPIIMGNARFNTYIVVLSILFYIIFIALLYSNDLLRLSCIILRFTTIFDIPWYLGFYIFLVSYIIYSLDKLSSNEQKIIYVQLRYLSASVIFMVILSIIDLLVLYNYDFFKIITGFKSIYWAYRIVPYLYLFVSPIVATGLHRASKFLGKSAERLSVFSTYTVMILLVILQIFSTSLTSSYTYIQTYEKGRLSETEYHIINYFIEKYTMSPRSNNMCVFAFSTRDRLILQYIPSNNNILSMFYDRIFLYETNRYVIVSVLLSMPCTRYYFVVNNLIEESHHIPETISLAKEYYSEYFHSSVYDIYMVTRNRLEELPHKQVGLSNTIAFIVHGFKVNGNITIKEWDNSVLYEMNCSNFTILRDGLRSYFMCDGRIHAGASSPVKILANGIINIKELILGCEPRELCELFSLISIRPIEFSGYISFTSMLYGYWILGNNLIVHGLYERFFNEILQPIIFLSITYIVILFLSAVIAYHVRRKGMK